MPRQARPRPRPAARPAPRRRRPQQAPWPAPRRPASCRCRPQRRRTLRTRRRSYPRSRPDARAHRVAATTSLQPGYTGVAAWVHGVAAWYACSCSRRRDLAERGGRMLRPLATSHVHGHSGLCVVAGLAHGLRVVAAGGACLRKRRRRALAAHQGVGVVDIRGRIHGAEVRQRARHLRRGGGQGEAMVHVAAARMHPLSESSHAIDPLQVHRVRTSGMLFAHARREHETTMAVAPVGSRSIHAASCPAPSAPALVSKHAARGTAGGSSAATQTPSRPTTSRSRPQPAKRSTPDIHGCTEWHC